MNDDVFPDRAMPLDDKIAWMIETRGYAVEPVDADPTASPPRGPYTYTVGLWTMFQAPEVAVVGLTPVAASGLISLVVDFLTDGVSLPVGAEFTGLLDGEQRSALVEVDDAHRHLFGSVARWYQDQAVPIVQLVWPDRSGFLPWETGFATRLRLAQPLLGEPPSR